MNSPHLRKGSKQPAPQPKGKLRLYSNRFCPYSQRVMLVLDIKRIPYDVVNINLYSKPDWYYDKSPYGKVPALELENGEVLYESLIIADYLDEKYRSTPLHQVDPLKKAKERLLIEEFNRIVNIITKSLSMIGCSNFDDDEIIANGLLNLEQQLQKRRTLFFGGSTPGMLDLMIWPWFERAEILKIFGNCNLLKKDKYRSLLRWCNIMKKYPGVEHSLMESDIHIKYLQSYRAGRPDYDMILNSN